MNWRHKCLESGEYINKLNKTEKLEKEWKAGKEYQVRM
jgi:hypothetical protein